MQPHQPTWDPDDLPEPDELLSFLALYSQRVRMGAPANRTMWDIADKDIGKAASRKEFRESFLCQARQLAPRLCELARLAPISSTTH